MNKKRDEQLSSSLLFLLQAVFTTGNFLLSLVKLVRYSLSALSDSTQIDKTATATNPPRIISTYKEFIGNLNPIILHHINDLSVNNFPVSTY